MRDSPSLRSISCKTIDELSLSWEIVSGFLQLNIYLIFSYLFLSFFFFGFGFSFLKTLFTICIYSCSRAEADCHLETDPGAAGTAFLPSSLNVRDKSLFTAVIRYPRSDIGCPPDTRYQIGRGRG